MNTTRTKTGRGRTGTNKAEAILARVEAAQLGRTQTFCLALSWYHGLTQREISEALGLSQQAVSRQLRGAAARLREAGVRHRRRRRFVRPLEIQAPSSWLDQLSPEEIKAGW